MLWWKIMTTVTWSCYDKWIHYMSQRMMQKASFNPATCTVYKWFFIHVWVTLGSLVGTAGVSQHKAKQRHLQQRAYMCVCVSICASAEGGRVGGRNWRVTAELLQSRCAKKRGLALLPSTNPHTQVDVWTDVLVVIVLLCCVVMVQFIKAVCLSLLNDTLLSKHLYFVMSAYIEIIKMLYNFLYK